MGVRATLLLSFALLLLAAPSVGAAPSIRWSVVASHPHDPSAFTEGLVAYGGVLLESTGLDGQSTIRRVDPTTGAVLLERWLPAMLFGEGLTVLGGSAVQLTWTEHRLLAWEPAALTPTANRRYPYVGWGLTTNGRQLIASDGTATVRWLDPATLKVRRAVRVHDGARVIDRINELELRDGILWANVWRSDRIALIDPADGHVRAWVDCAALRRRLTAPGEVLNGIARDPVTDRMAVTGKDWPQLFVIRLVGRVPA